VSSFSFLTEESNSALPKIEEEHNHNNSSAAAAPASTEIDLFGDMDQIIEQLPATDAQLQQRQEQNDLFMEMSSLSPQRILSSSDEIRVPSSVSTPTSIVTSQPGGVNNLVYQESSVVASKTYDDEPSLFDAIQSLSQEFWKISTELHSKRVSLVSFRFCFV